jgi:PAS domain S-box-containing protein
MMTKSLSSDLQSLSEELDTHRFELEMSVQELQEKNQLLQEREEYLTNMIEHASEGIMTINHIGMIESANNVLAQLLGYDTLSLKNKPINLFINNEIKGDVSTFIVRKCHEYSHFKSEAFLKNRFSEERIPVQISISMLKNQRSKKFLVIITDISKIAQMQKDLAFERSEKERLLKMHDDLDQFVYRVSHDLRAPLASSIGLVELSKLESDKNRIDEYLNLQSINLHRLQDFIGSILQFSRNSRNNVERNEINFQEILDTILEQIRYSEPASKIDFKLNVSQDGAFWSDQVRLKIILNNLVSNSIKYSDPNKSDKKIEITINADTDFAEIKIKDNGIGIEEEYIEKIFDPFFRATDYNNGSGIGLALVKEAVNKISGYIQATSVYRKSTTLIVHLPSLC